MHLVVRVPATSANLGPGFDALGVALARHLDVVLGARHGGPRVVTTGAGAGVLATDDDNLVWRSFVLGCDALDHPVPDVRLDAHNDILTERGLGSSSSAIVAGLTLARAVATATPSDLDMVELAADLEGHPDNVAPAIMGGVVTAGRALDGHWVVRRAQPASGLVALAAIPSVRSRTEQTRRALPDHLSVADVVDQGARLGHVLGGLLGTWPLDADLAGDRLHEPTRLPGMPASRALVDAWRATGTFAVLSGAGPTVLALVDRRPDVVAAAVDVARAAARDAGIEVEVTALDWDLRGAVACPADD